MLLLAFCFPQGMLSSRMANLGIQDDLSSRTRGSQVVALGCKMVGGGTDGSLDLCARVCLIDESENIIFHAYVKPQIPVTNYRFDPLLQSLITDKTPVLNLHSWKHFRYETTGVRPEFLRDAMPVKQVQRKIQDFLCNGEPVWKIRSRGGMARILVGHGLDHDLECLQMEYPTLMIR